MSNSGSSIGNGPQKIAPLLIKQKRGSGAWSTQQEQELIRLVKNGASFEALAVKFQRSPRAVAQKLGRLGLDVAAAIYKACQGGCGHKQACWQS